MFNSALRESGHTLQKFRDTKKLGDSDKMLRLATSFTSEEQYISSKNIYVVYMEAAGHTETADLTTGSLGERLEWL